MVQHAEAPAVFGEVPNVAVVAIIQTTATETKTTATMIHPGAIITVFWYPSNI